MKNILFVVDLQKDFIDKDKCNYNKILNFIRHSNYDSIIATQFVSGNINYKKRLNWDFTPIPNPIEFTADIIINKSGYGLTEEQYNSLPHNNCHYDIIGCETDACVLKIAMDMFDKGFDFSILPKYTYTNSSLQESAINILKRNIGL